MILNYYRKKVQYSRGSLLFVSKNYYTPRLKDLYSNKIGSYSGFRGVGWGGWTQLRKAVSRVVEISITQDGANSSRF